SPDHLSYPVSDQRLVRYVYGGRGNRKGRMVRLLELGFYRTTRRLLTVTPSCNDNGRGRRGGPGGARRAPLERRASRTRSLRPEGRQRSWRDRCRRRGRRRRKR